MNFKEVLLIVNPISGQTDKSEIICCVQKKIKEENKNFHLFTTTGNNDKENIQTKINKKNIDRVIVAGGDGTINLVAEVLKGLDISLGIITAGSANGMAENLNLPEILEEQLEVALGANYIELDILCLNDTICLHMSDFGINAELIKNYENSTVRGKIGYFLQSIPTLIQSEYPFTFNIETKNDTKQVNAVLLGIANANKYGTGANVNPQGKLNDGVFEILIFKKLNLVEILKTLQNETDLDSDFVEIIPAENAKITCEKPVSFQIDGEYIGKESEVEIKILPEKLRIAIPQ